VNNFIPEENAASLQVDVLPDPPTPIMSELPRGIRKIREMVTVC